jgi:hypothetical protein
MTATVADLFDCGPFTIGSGGLLEGWVLPGEPFTITDNTKKVGITNRTAIVDNKWKQLTGDQSLSALGGVEVMMQLAATEYKNHI